MDKTFVQHISITLLNPRSVAIIGASEDQTKFGGRLYRHLLQHGYDGEVYPINPKRDTLFDRKAYPSVSATPAPPDMAVMAIPRAQVKAEVVACAVRGTKACIIITTKFSDAGAEGRALEQEIVAAAAEHGMRLIGPNCLGMISPVNHLVLCASPALNVEQLIESPIGLISQSGALMGTLFDRAYSMGIGFSHCVSVGNQADLELTDFIEILINDDKTKVICSYVEGIKSPKRLVALARQARAAGKPWLMVKAGATEYGSRAAYSHTASMAGDFEALEAVCRHEKIIMLEDPINMLSLANAMVRYPNRRMGNIAIITNSGGGGALMADRLTQAGLSLSTFSEKTRKELANHYGEGQGANPIDMGGRKQGNATDCAAITAEITLADENTDMGLMVLTTAPDVPGVTRLLADGAESERAGGKPTFYVMLPGRLAASSRAMLTERRLPYVDMMAEAVSVLKAWKEWSEYGEPVIPVRPSANYQFKMPKPGILGEFESKALLAAAGVPVNRGVIVTSVEEAIARSADMGYPLVLKVVSTDIAHKTDVGGIALNITGEAELRERFTRMQERIAKAAPQACIDGFYLQNQEGGELELIVGARYDAQFGAQILIGAGGVLVELLKDIVVLPAPIDAVSARAALAHLKVARLLGAYRGRGPLDIDAVVDVVVRLGWLAHDLSKNVPGGDFEIEVNPLKLRLQGHGAVAIDARARIGSLK